MKLFTLPEREGTIGLFLSNGIISSSRAYGSCLRKGRSFDLSSDSWVLNAVVDAGALCGSGKGYCLALLVPGVIGDLIESGDVARVSSGTVAESPEMLRRGTGLVILALRWKVV